MSGLDLVPVLLDYEKWLEEQEAHYLERALKLSSQPNHKVALNELHAIANTFRAALYMLKVHERVMTPPKRRGIFATIFGG